MVKIKLWALLFTFGQATGVLVAQCAIARGVLVAQCAIARTAP